MAANWYGWYLVLPFLAFLGNKQKKSGETQKKPTRNFSARNSGAGKRPRQLYGRLAFFGTFCWKTPTPIKFLVLGGGGGREFFGRGGGGSADFILWARRFF